MPDNYKAPYSNSAGHLTYGNEHLATTALSLLQELGHGDVQSASMYLRPRDTHMRTNVGVSES